MKNVKLGKSNLAVPRIAVGCMRIADMGQTELKHFVKSAIEAGANFFDHADIYGNGECEEAFAKAMDMKPSEREKIILQSKCGIVPGVMYDFSKEHIIKSVDGILKRLRTEYLDILLLHRPDALMEPEEVAEAFDCLEKQGKVRNFGVSNQNPMQMALLQKYVKQPLVTNQLQFSIASCNMVSNGIHVNMKTDAAVSRDGSVLDYCRLHDITIQTWSPLQYGFFEGVFVDNAKFPQLNQCLEKIAQKYQQTATTIAIAWILRHPANMVAVTGTTNEYHLAEYLKADEVTLTREEWYEIYLAAGNELP